MATPRKKSNGQKPLSNVSTFVCCRCGERKDIKKFYGTASKFYTTHLRIPICSDCIDDMYMEYCDEYKGMGYANPEKKAVERVCMAMDVYYKDSLFESAKKSWEKKPDVSIMIYYMRNSRLSSMRLKTYDQTLKESYDATKDKEAIRTIYTDDDKEIDRRVVEGRKMFGSGFDREDYVFLYNEYTDWTSRHECDTKSKEELIKQICFVQLDLFKANRAGRDTKTLNDTLTKLMDAAKLQPKQNAGDTTADNQTLGTLIDKWENTRPIPEIDEELKDVDRIGQYIDVFYRGHLAKMLNIKNAFSRLYDKFMKKYTVTKPEYTEEEDNEALFDAVFGRDMDDNFSSDDEEVV